MAPTPPSTAAPPPATPAPVLLEKLAGSAAKHVGEQLGAMIARLVAALLDASAPALDARAVYQRVKSGNILKNNSYAFVHLASTAIDNALQKELAQLAPAARRAATTPATALALVPMEEMDRSVAFGSLSRPFEIAHSEALATLNVRLGYMLERDILRMGQNPFRPEVFLIALQQAWCDFEPDTEAHDLLLPLLRPDIALDLAPLYEALNQALMRKGGADNEAMRIRKTTNAVKAQASRAQQQAALEVQLRKFLAGSDAAPAPFDAAIPLIPDLPSLAGGGNGWRPSAAGAFAGAAQPAGHPAVGNPGAAGAPHGHPQAGPAAPQSPAATPAGAAIGQVNAQLVEFLGKLQVSLPPAQPGAPAAHNVFYLPRLKESLPKGSLTRGDESTIDLLSRIFETVALDDSIPSETRELIQFLQVPVLKAALLDKDFFFEEAHPARRMIDLLSRMGWEQRGGPQDPLLQAMRRNVDRVGRNFGQEAGVFAAAVTDLEATLEAEEASAAAAISEPIARALKQEKVAAAGKAARTAVALRVGRGELVAVVESFLAHKWTDVLTLAYSVEPDKPGAVGHATRTMDDLIWSVRPKVTHEQRKQLIARLPGLLATLNKWLDVIKWQEAERLQFFAELAECHAAIVRAPLELSPERQLEIAVEAAQQDALRRLQQENAVAAEEDAAVDEAVLSVDAFERGMWLEFTGPDGGARQVKLAWISPLRSLFIFSTGARQEAFSLSAEKLAAAWREQSVRVIRQSGVVARALSAAMNQPDVKHLSAVSAAA